MYKVFFREKALKALQRKLHPKDKDRILQRIEVLSEDPFSSSLDVKKLSGFENIQKAYRLRVGEIRVIYELDTQTKKIIIYKIDYRRTTTY